MSNEKTNSPSWLDEVTKVDSNIVEPFQPNAYKPNLIPFNGYYVVANRPQGGKKFAYALRIEEDINSELDQCQGSKNAVINALLRYALEDLKAKKKTLAGD